MALSSTLPHDRAPRPAARGLTRRAATALRALTGRHWTLHAGAVVLVLVIAALLLTPWIAPYDPAHQDLAHRLAAPSAQHWLGTDQLGRDVLSRLMYGGRFSVSIAAVTLVLSAVAGTVIGAFSARRGGVVDEIVMRTTDLLISIPDVVVALFLIAAFGTGYGMLIAALTIVGWTPFARLMRGLALEINSREYIEAAEALGCSKTFIVCSTPPPPYAARSPNPCGCTRDSAAARPRRGSWNSCATSASPNPSAGPRRTHTSSPEAWRSA